MTRISSLAVLIVLGAGGIEVQRVHAAAQAAIAGRRILGRGDRDLGLLDRVDHRHHDAPGAGVEQSA